MSILSAAGNWFIRVASNAWRRFHMPQEKFILSRELGRLAKWLRILGYDTAYFNQDNLSSLIIQALRDGRMVITKNHRLSQRKGVRIALVRHEKIREQIGEILGLLRIRPDPKMLFTRCVLCNIGLVRVNKSSVKKNVPEYVFKTQDNFITCPQCNRIYWQGTHWGNVKNTLKEIDSL